MSTESSWTNTVDDPRKVHDLIALRVDENPDVTVLVPVHNEAKNIVTCLHTIGLASKNTQHKVEVLCMNSASTDTSPQLIDACGARRVDTGKGVGVAREAGIFNAVGRHVITTDADTRVPPTWIDAHMRHYGDEEVGGVAAKYRFDKVHPLYPAYFQSKEWLRAIITSLPYISRKLVDEKAPDVWFAGANMSWDNEVFRDGGPLNLPNQCEDTVIGRMIQSAGRKIAYDSSPENTVLTSGRRYRTFGQVSSEILFDMANYVRRRVQGQDVLPSRSGKPMDDIRDVDLHE